RRRAGHDGGPAGARAGRRHRAEQRQRTAADHLRQQVRAPAAERARTGHIGQYRDSRDGDSRAGHGVTGHRAEGIGHRAEGSGLSAIVVDDEALARDELGFLLGELGGVDIVGQAGNGLEAVETISRLRPDVVFLDIQMPGLTGFEVARRMIDADSPTQIIFVTAYDQHAIEAFEVNAVDYLLKPVDPARLELALERARKRVALERGEKVAGVSPEQLEKIVEAVAERRNRRDRLALKVGERFLLVAADEV